MIRPGSGIGAGASLLIVGIFVHTFAWPRQTANSISVSLAIYEGGCQGATLPTTAVFYITPGLWSTLICVRPTDGDYVLTDFNTAQSIAAWPGV